MTGDDCPALQLPGDFWKRKIAALLYRCPDAALYDEAALDARRQQLFDKIKEAGLDLNQYLREVERANQMAWAADRPPLDGVPNDFILQRKVSHPFSSMSSGKLWTEDVNVDDLSAAVDCCVVDLVTENLKNNPDGRKAFFALWRLLEERLEAATVIGRNWKLMPADGRLNDSIWSHMSTASAIAGAGNQPAFLIFTLAGTQDFISQARRSQDFWAGSFVIAWLSWAAMRCAAESLGPDVVVLPILRKQPLVDHWLSRDMGIEGLTETSSWQRTVANLPNVFTLIVPWEQARTIGECLEKAVRDERDRLFKEVRNLLTNLRFPIADPRWMQLWDEQQAEFLEVELFWAAAPWSDDPVQALKELKEERQKLGASASGDDTVGETIASIESIQPAESPGAAYAIASGLTSQVLTTRKNTRGFPKRPAWSNLGACTLCGQRPALHRSGDTEVGNLRTFWEEEHKYWPRTVRSGERLCAVCLVKRLAFESYLEQELGLRKSTNDSGQADDQDDTSNELPFRFPSTSSIATASFKDKVLRQPELQQQLQAFLGKLEETFTDSKIKWTVNASTMPRRIEQLLERPKPGFIQNTDLIRRFLRIDGEWLYEDSYQKESIKREYGVDIDDGELEKVRKKLESLIKAAEGLKIRPPAKYYAIIVADGDKAGDWIGGLRNPTYGQALNPGVDLASVSGLDWFGKRRPSGPASQGALAAALSDFALQRVPELVEKHYGGKLIYAGGDDVVAMVPLWNHTRDDNTDEPRHVFDLVDRLANAFRDDFHDDGSFGLGRHALDSGKPAASLSVNVIILHHSEQLALHISGGFAGLKSYVKKALDRNALGIDAIKRSGAGLRAGAKWTAGEYKPVDQLAKLMDHLGANEERVLSPRLARELAMLSPSLKTFVTGDEALKRLAMAEITRLTGRRTTGDDAKESPVVDDVKDLFEALIAMSDQMKPVPSGSGEVVVNPWELLVGFLDIAQFVQREA